MNDERLPPDGWQTQRKLSNNARHRIINPAEVALGQQANQCQPYPMRSFQRRIATSPTKPVAPNRLKQDFTATAPNERWVADVTYIPTGEGWLYLAIILDLYSRKVVGWSTSARLQRDLVLEALNMALGRRTLASGLIHHSDRGSQYASHEFQDLLRDHGIACSMSGAGNCYDNAVAESFFATLKRERVHRCHYQTRAKARTDIFTYIEVFYNRQRRHSSLDQRSPDQFERQVFKPGSRIVWKRTPVDRA